jgi:hypothetical protein
MRRTLIATAALAILPVLGGAQRSDDTLPGGTSTAVQQDTTGRQHTAARDTTRRTRRATATKRRTKAQPATARRRDSAQARNAAPGKPANQTESGVVNAKTGTSTLGPQVKKTRPDQGQPTTSKGDTLKRGGDSVKARTRPPR